KDAILATTQLGGRTEQRLRDRVGGNRLMLEEVVRGLSLRRLAKHFGDATRRRSRCPPGHPHQPSGTSFIAQLGVSERLDRPCALALHARQTIDTGPKFPRTDRFAINGQSGLRCGFVEPHSTVAPREPPRLLTPDREKKQRGRYGAPLFGGRGKSRVLRRKAQGQDDQLVLEVTTLTGAVSRRGARDFKLRWKMLRGARDTDVAISVTVAGRCGGRSGIVSTSSKRTVDDLVFRHTPATVRNNGRFPLAAGCLHVRLQAQPAVVALPTLRQELELFGAKAEAILARQLVIVRFQLLEERPPLVGRRAVGALGDVAVHVNLHLVGNSRPEPPGAAKRVVADLDPDDAVGVNIRGAFAVAARRVADPGPDAPGIDFENGDGPPDCRLFQTRRTEQQLAVPALHH